jgi:hypothetical protein
VIECSFTLSRNEFHYSIWHDVVAKWFIYIFTIYRRFVNIEIDTSMLLLVSSQARKILQPHPRQEYMAKMCSKNRCCLFPFMLPSLLRVIFYDAPCLLLHSLRDNFNSKRNLNTIRVTFHPHRIVVSLRVTLYVEE